MRCLGIGAEQVQVVSGWGQLGKDWAMCWAHKENEGGRVGICPGQGGEDGRADQGLSVFSAR